MITMNDIKERQNMLTMSEILVYFAIKYSNDWNKIYKAINQKERVEQETAREVIDNYLAKKMYKYITIIDDVYPSKLKGVYKPPFVIFYKGDGLTTSEIEALHGGLGAFEFSGKLTQKRDKLYCGYVIDTETERHKVIYAMMPSIKEFESECYSNGYIVIKSHWVKKGTKEYCSWLAETTGTY
jgi:hypothetical protein